MKTTALTALLLLDVALTPACGKPAPSPTPAPAEPAPTVAAAPAAPAVTGDHLFDRVVVIGASATAGVGAFVMDTSTVPARTASTPLARVLRTAMPPALGGEVTNLSTLMFFAAPVATGTRLMDQALAQDPTLVIGIDFLFWFGYGARDVNGEPIRDASARMELLEAGLGVLERITCPLVIGDFPDMSPAVGLMLSPAQVPGPKTLEALNEHLRAWAGGRENVIVLPFARLVSDLRADRSVTLAGYTWPAGGTAALIGRDHLHPTVRGLIAVTQLILDELTRHAFPLRTASFELDPDKIVGRLLDELRGEAVAAPPAEPAGGPGGR